MENEEKITNVLQNKSHEVLIKLLNNIGVVGAILCAIADILCVTIFVVGFKANIDTKANVIFAIINAVIGLMINSLLRYQGQKYAEIENEQLRKDFYGEKAKEDKFHLPMWAWQGLNIFKDIIFKGCTTAFSIFGVIYISIEGSKNPIQIIIVLITLFMFACFGLMSMNSSYTRYYDIQVPYMKKIIKKKEEQKNGSL